MAADDPLRFSLPGVDGAKRSLGPPSTAPTYLSESASSSPARRRLLGSGRFNAEDLKCFQRIPSPSSTYQQKAEVYWQNMGPMRKVHGDLGLHTLPAMRGEFYRYRAASSPQEAKEETTRQEPVAEKPTLLPREEMTASLLDEIYPRRPPSREKEEDARGKSQNQKLRKQTASNLPEQTGHISGERATLANGLAANKNLSQASRRLIHFRQRILEKFSTMKSAFETFAQEHGPHGTTRELTKKEFSRFLFRHFNGLPKEEGRVDAWYDVMCCGALDRAHPGVLQALRRKRGHGWSLRGLHHGHEGKGRNYRGEVPMNITERFQQHVIDAEDATIKPVFCEDAWAVQGWHQFRLDPALRLNCFPGAVLDWGLSVRYNNLYLLAVTQRNSNATLIVAFLYRLAEVLRDYFNELEEESIKDSA
eukprot:s989_g2.t2